jgi:hypothetical protein
MRNRPKPPPAIRRIGPISDLRLGTAPSSPLSALLSLETIPLKPNPKAAKDAPTNESQQQANKSNKRHIAQISIGNLYIKRLMAHRPVNQLLEQRGTVEDGAGENAHSSRPIVLSGAGSHSVKVLPARGWL